MSPRQRVLVQDLSALSAKFSVSHRHMKRKVFNLNLKIASLGVHLSSGCHWILVVWVYLKTGNSLYGVQDIWDIIINNPLINNTDKQYVHLWREQGPY